MKQGARFSAVARQFSQSATAAVGGDMGWLRPDQLPPDLGKAGGAAQGRRTVAADPAPAAAITCCWSSNAAPAPARQRRGASER